MSNKLSARVGRTFPEPPDANLVSTTLTMQTGQRFKTIIIGGAPIRVRNTPKPEIGQQARLFDKQVHA